jgi:amidohydrolase
MEAELPGRVRVIFQPAEETFPGGAYDMLREGILDGVSAILSFHVDPSLEPGRVGLRPGPITSSADRFYITLEGPGGHTARPHATVDLVYAAGLVITQLPSLVDRLVDSRAPVVVVFGKVQGGTADNVIPTQVQLSGTLRTADRAVWETMPALVERLTHGLVAPLGARAIVHYQRGIPPCVNDPEVIRLIEGTVARVLGPEASFATHLSMGAEDFARYLEVIPGALVRLGCRTEGPPVDLHSAHFRFDEAALEIGVKVGTAAMLDLLSQA